MKISWNSCSKAIEKPETNSSVRKERLMRIARVAAVPLACVGVAVALAYCAAGAFLAGRFSRSLPPLGIPPDEKQLLLQPIPEPIQPAESPQMVSESNPITSRSWTSIALGLGGLAVAGLAANAFLPERVKSELSPTMPPIVRYSLEDCHGVVRDLRNGESLHWTAYAKVINRTARVAMFCSHRYLRCLSENKETFWVVGRIPTMLWIGTEILQIPVRRREQLEMIRQWQLTDLDASLDSQGD